MKRIILLAVALVCVLSATKVNAQAYKLNKQHYNYQLYIPQYDDPHSPALAGVASFFIPGLGQMISGEVGRGFAFLGGVAGCYVLTSIGMMQLTLNNMDYDPYYSTGVSTRGLGTIFLGLAGIVVLDIWSIVDAVRVAKVNNMYIQDIRNTSRIEWEMSPYVEPISFNNTTSASVGFTMRMRF
ncbi:hypothetical protein D0T49_11690 [Paludibacter sp. 221]|uniref:hypothetical protein n=1 Tax=Paludibacter sp. 221 TaxID=2302939 RepID=UPI0013D8B45E|nr:hypothetical protein [Paludibacter sp. 221]NDV47709.1 hypothetical protein [Paludibacter sp. 221]